MGGAFSVPVSPISIGLCDRFFEAEPTRCGDAISVRMLTNKEVAR